MAESTKIGIGRRALAVGAGSAALGFALSPGRAGAQAKKQIAYITPGLNFPFWRVLARGIAAVAERNGASATTFDDHDNAEEQIRLTQDAIARKVDGIILSPTDSSTAPMVLELAQRAGIPVVIADIGTTHGEYVSFIISDNFQGAYGIGKVLAADMRRKGWTSGTFGMVTIPLARNNGKARTGGFRKAMKEGGYSESALSQMQSGTADETFKFVQDMLTAHPDMRGLFIESDLQTVGALRAVQAMRRENEILIAGFDGIPEFVKLIESGQIVGSGMQQPYLMGVRSGQAMIDHFAGKTPPKQILVPIEVVTEQNIGKLLPTITTTVFGNELT